MGPRIRIHPKMSWIRNTAGIPPHLPPTARETLPSRVTEGPAPRWPPVSLPAICRRTVPPFTERERLLVEVIGGYFIYCMTNNFVSEVTAESFQAPVTMHGCLLSEPAYRPMLGLILPFYNRELGGIIG